MNVNVGLTADLYYTYHGLCKYRKTIQTESKLQK